MYSIHYKKLQRLEEIGLHSFECKPTKTFSFDEIKSVEFSPLN